VVRVMPRPLLTPGKDLGTRRTGGWVGLRAGVDTEARGKIISLPVIELCLYFALTEYEDLLCIHCHGYLYNTCATLKCHRNLAIEWLEFLPRNLKVTSLNLGRQSCYADSEQA
jgi:hypothetical protein